MSARITRLLVVLAIVLWGAEVVTHPFTTPGYAQQNGNGNGGNGNSGGNGNGNGGGGNAGGNGNGNDGGGNAGGNGGGNAGGNGAGNAGGAAPSKSLDKPTKSFTKPDISKAEVAVERSRRSYDKAITLAEKTKKALLLALLDADSSLAVVKDIRRLVQSAKPTPRLANLLKKYEEAMMESDNSLAFAYNNHLKALKLLEQSRAVLKQARTNLKTMRARQ